jgi:hypothetical protein
MVSYDANHDSRYLNFMVSPVHGSGICFFAWPGSDILPLAAGLNVPSAVFS